MNVFDWVKQPGFYVIWPTVSCLIIVFGWIVGSLWAGKKRMWVRTWIFALGAGVCPVVSWGGGVFIPAWMLFAQPTLWPLAIASIVSAWIPLFLIYRSAVAIGIKRQLVRGPQ